MKLQHLLAVTLVAAAAPAGAGVESASGYWTGLGPQGFALTAGNGFTATSGRNYSDAGSPTLPHVDGAAGSTADGLSGRLRGGASAFSSVSGSQGWYDSNFYTTAAITDQLVWNGQSPLRISLDVDWSTFSAQALGPDYGAPGMTNVATVAMRFGYYLSYLDPVMGETMLARRTLVRTQFDHTDGTEDGFALVHTNGVDAAAQISGSSYRLDATIAALGFDPGLVDVTFTLGVDVGCSFAAGAVVNHGTTCAASADLWGTAYAGIQGDFRSTSGYAYLGRQAAPPPPPPPPPNGVPEPSGLALALAALGVIGWRRRVAAGSATANATASGTAAPG